MAEEFSKFNMTRIHTEANRNPSSQDENLNAREGFPIDEFRAEANDIGPNQMKIPCARFLPTNFVCVD